MTLHPALQAFALGELLLTIILASELYAVIMQ